MGPHLTLVYGWGAVGARSLPCEQTNIRLNITFPRYRPRTKYEGRVMFSLCLSIHWGRRVPHSGPRTRVSSSPPLPLARTRTGVLLTAPARTRTEVSSNPTPQLPTPPCRQDTPQTVYGVGGTPLAFTRRRTFSYYICGS